MAAAAFASVFIGLRLCHSRGARWYSYGGRLFHIKKRYLKIRYLYFAPPDSFRRADFGFGFAFLIIQAARPLALYGARWPPSFLIQEAARPPLALSAA